MTKDQNQARAILFRNKGQNTFHWLETKPKSGSWLRGTLFDIHWPSNAFTAIGFIFSTKQFILTTKEVLFKRSRNKLKIHQALSASSVIQWAVGDRENNRWWSEIQWQWNEIWWQEEVTGWNRNWREATRPVYPVFWTTCLIPNLTPIEF